MVSGVRRAAGGTVWIGSEIEYGYGYALTVKRKGQRASTDAGLWMFSSSMGMIGWMERKVR